MMFQVPLNWPLGDGPRFRGVYDREKGQVCLFERTTGGQFKAPIQVSGIEGDEIKGALDADLYEQVVQEIELLDGVTEELDMEAVLAGKQMPVFFGSAMNNFGVQVMLERYLELAPPPAPRASGEEMVDPMNEDFTGFHIQ